MLVLKIVAKSFIFVKKKNQLQSVISQNNNLKIVILWKNGI